MPNSTAIPSINPSISYLRGKRVVVVEDEGVTIMMLQQVLQRKHAKVVAVCKSLDDMIPIVVEHKPDLLVMGLPPHAEPTVVSSVRDAARDEQPCIVVLTTHMTRHHAALLREAGASGIIQKPFVAQQLMEEIEAAYRSGRCETEEPEGA